MASDKLISWFWEKFQKHPPIAGRENGLCQCAVRKFLEQSQETTQMLSFLMISVFLDQMVFTHYPNIYRKFRGIFQFPKLYQHGGGGMASPGWFVSSFHGYDKKLDWRSAHETTQPLIHDFLSWLATEFNSENTVEQFMALAKKEIYREFEEHTAPKFWELFKSDH